MNDVGTLLVAQWKLHKASPKVVGYAVARAVEAGAIDFSLIPHSTPLEAAQQAAQQKEKLLRDFTMLPIAEQTKYIAATKEDLGPWYAQFVWWVKFVWWRVSGGM